MEQEQSNTKPTAKNGRLILPKHAALEIFGVALLDLKRAGIDVRFGELKGKLVLNIAGVFYDQAQNNFKLLPENTWQ